MSPWVRRSDQRKRLTEEIITGAFSLTAADDYNHYRSYVIATTAGVFGLFPLLIKPMGKHRRGGSHALGST